VSTGRKWLAAGTLLVVAAATPTVSGLQGSDTVTGLVEVYTDPNAGSAKTLTVTGYTVNDGNSGGNYTVSLVNDTTGVINPRPLTVAASWPQAKVQGYPDPTLNYVVSSGSLAGSDTLNGSLARVPGETPGLYMIGMGSLSAGPNYQLTFIGAAFVIAPFHGPLDQMGIARSDCGEPLGLADIHSQSTVHVRPPSGEGGWDAACGGQGIRQLVMQPPEGDIVLADEAATRGAAGRTQ